MHTYIHTYIRRHSVGCLTQNIIHNEVPSVMAVLTFVLQACTLWIFTLSVCSSKLWACRQLYRIGHEAVLTFFGAVG